MTVSELIERLKKAEQTKDVLVACPGWGYERLDTFYDDQNVIVLVPEVQMGVVEHDYSGAK